MASSCEKLDQLVKDYLLFRGFSATFKALEQDLKTDKDKGLRVDKMMEQIWTLISSYDLSGLRDYWRYLNQRLFSRLDYRYAQSIHKLESSLFKLYLVNAHQCVKHDKVRSFFELMGPDLQSVSDFKEWFAFPFVANPSENAMFSVHFTKQWQDTLQLSLHNFLSVVLQAMLPTLLNVEFDARRMKALQEENLSLKQQLMNGAVTVEPVKDTRPFTRRSFQSELHPPTSPPDMVYDFSGLANELEPSESEGPKQKITRRFPLSLTSPLGGRKKSEASQNKPKVTTATSSSLTSSTSNVEEKPKTTELSVFPPQSGIKTSTSKKLTASALSSTTGQSSKQPQGSVLGSSSASSSHSPLPGRKQMAAQISTTNTSTLSSMTTAPSSLSSGMLSDPRNNGNPHAMAGRSISAPEGKKSQWVKRMGGSVDNPNLVNEKLGTEGDRSSISSTGSSSTIPEITDPDSPFLLLEMDEYMEHRSSVCYGQFSPNGQYVASLDMDGVVKVWSWSPAPTTQATIMSRAAFLSLTWHHKWDRWLLLGNKSGSIRLFDVTESKTFREVEIQSDNPQNCMRVTDISSSPNGNHFVCATANHCPFTTKPSSVSGKLFQWDLKALKMDRALQVDSDTCNAITCSCYSPTGQLITGGADGLIRIYDEGKPKAALKWLAHNSPIHSVQFRGKGDVYSIDNDGTLSQWSLSQPGAVVNTFYIGTRQNSTSTGVGSCRGRLLSLDASGHYLLTYKGMKGAIYKLEGQSEPSPVMELKAHQAPVMTVDWSPSQETFSSIPSQDTKHCLTGSADGRIKISTLLSK